MTNTLKINKGNANVENHLYCKLAEGWGEKDKNKTCHANN